MGDKKCENCGIKYKDCEYCLEFTSLKDNLIKCKYWCCNKNYQKKVLWKLKKAIC